jgi:hypothetical protein
MTDYIKKIEERLGEYKRLPKIPFISDCIYALFPASEDDFVDEKLYTALFQANKQQGNNFFIVKPLLDIKGKEVSVLMQEELNWSEFESFQGSSLVYEGFYITGEHFNWLGIYHNNDYVLIGANDELTNFVTTKLYGNGNWQSHFEEAYINEKMDMYESDYQLLKNSLFLSK